MTWLPDAAAPNERDTVLGRFPEAYAAQRAFLAACDEAFDEELLALCRARMAQVLRCREELASPRTARLAHLQTWWERPADYTELQRDALSFVEQFILDPSQITPELAASLERALGTSGVLDFTVVLSAIEGALRLSTLLDLEPAT